jgi:hypothetical protein
MHVLIGSSFLVPMQLTAFESEDFLQGLLAGHPGLMPGALVDRLRPRRWLRVTLRKNPPFDQLPKRAAFMKRLNDIEGINLAASDIDARPSVNADILTSPHGQASVLTTLEWVHRRTEGIDGVGLTQPECPRHRRRLIRTAKRRSRCSRANGADAVRAGASAPRHPRNCAEGETSWRSK